MGEAGGRGPVPDPSRPDVRDCIAAGVLEILDGYAVDGIHLDDYFYPTTDEAFDAAEYAAADTNLSLEDWRRDNVNALVRQLYQLVHAGGRTAGAVPLGISPQGNNDNNYAQQYSDAALWLSTPGYIDYAMPQVYWGYGYTTGSGSTRFAFLKTSPPNGWPCPGPRGLPCTLALGPTASGTATAAITTMLKTSGRPAITWRTW